MEEGVSWKERIKSSMSWLWKNACTLERKRIAFLPGRNITKQNPEKRKMAYICNLAYFPEPVHTLPIGTRLQPNQTPLDRFILLKV
jgi:hypothetical protein